MQLIEHSYYCVIFASPVSCNLQHSMCHLRFTVASADTFCLFVLLQIYVKIIINYVFQLRMETEAEVEGLLNELQ